MQYLLNASAIWLISLAAFDVFLRRESYHGYNRFYLLCTFALGLMLPAVTSQSYEYLQPVLQRPVENIISIREGVAAATTEKTIDSIEWIYIIYYAGVCVALLLLVIDVIKLITYYNKGQKWKEGGWTIVATGSEHAPFSIMKLLFVASREQYSDAEWHMLCKHELQHAAKWHLADVVLMQVAKAVLWFHPLVYVYNTRLLMVHEYQADNESAESPAVYGQFLVEQAMLGTAPVIAHSFNRSPIKKRIVMLTRRSGKAARARMLAFIPVLVVSILCFSQNGFSQKFERNGNTVTFRGNKFEMKEPQEDSIELEDPATGQRFWRVVRTDSYPIKMNGKKVFNTDEAASAPAYVGPDGHLWNHVMKQAKNNLMQMGEGEYVLNANHFIVDEHGNIVYYNYFDIGKMDGKKMRTDMLSKDQQQRISEAISRILVNIKGLRPAIFNGKPVICEIYDKNFWNHFKIEGKKMYIQDGDGKWTAI